MSDIHTLSGAYALDALESDEQAAFERHLSGCPSCQAEVQGLREAAVLLATTCPAAPPAELRARVLAEAATVRPLPPRLAPVVDLAAHRRSRRVVALIAAAAAVLAVGAGGAVVERLRDEPAVTEASASAVDQVLTAPDAEIFSQAAFDGGTITVVRSASLGQAALVTEGLARVPAGQTRELWLQHGNAFLPAGYLGNGPDHRVLLAGDPASAKAFGMTVEPASGSASPSDRLVAKILYFKDA